MDFESISTIIFIVVLIVVLYLNRRKVAVQKIAYFFIFLVLYRTKLGLRLMNRLAKRLRKALIYLSYLMILVGFAAMVFISFTLIKNAYGIITKPAAVPGVGLVLPVEAKGVFYVPFFYWIISIFVLAVVHEFSHGLIARAHRLRIKSSGLAFLAVLVPLIPAAFVEPDEKQLRKAKPFKQLSMYAAGSFANIAFALVLLLIFNLAAPPVMNSIVDYNGVVVQDIATGNTTYPAQLAGLIPGEIIQQVDNVSVQYYSNFTDIMKTKKPGDKVSIATDKKSYELVLAPNPQNISLGYMGIYATQSTRIKPSFRYGKFTANVILWFTGRPFHGGEIFAPGLIPWLVLLNLGIGLFNLAPLGPMDGGRMLLTVLERYLKPELAQKVWKYVSGFFLLIIVANILFGFVR